MSEQDFGDLARRDTERHLLLAVDESENSKRAVMYVADFFSGNPDVFVTLLSIIPEPTDDFFPTEEKRQQWLEEQKNHMDCALANYKGILLSAGLNEKQIEVRLVIRHCTSIGEAILEEQAKLRCCIVVVGRRGLTHNEEFLFGSTSNRILHHATHCAVMIVE
ncbi:MAG: universal stress protein [Desulfobulbaceae bacterium]|jgi:nucleotide-binding universal stress UspA family protein|nr:universal stress protein [Desulfobulbaceae bacterium]